MGTVFLTILLVIAMLGAAFMLIRGIVAFLQTTKEDLNSQSTGPSASGLRQNKAMFGRIAFQAVAVLILALLLLLKR
jgi:hypothetical protein